MATTEDSQGEEKRLIKISDRLYRIYSNGRYKDCWIRHGKILPPENPYNTLTPTEQMLIEMELF